MLTIFQKLLDRGKKYVGATAARHRFMDGKSLRKCITDVLKGANLYPSQCPKSLAFDLHFVIVTLYYESMQDAELKWLFKKTNK